MRARRELDLSLSRIVVSMMSSMSNTEGTEFWEISHISKNANFLPQVGFQRHSIWVRFELVNQLFDFFFACIVFLFNRGVW